MDFKQTPDVVTTKTKLDYFISPSKKIKNVKHIPLLLNFGKLIVPMSKYGLAHKCA